MNPCVTGTNFFGHNRMKKKFGLGENLNSGHKSHTGNELDGLEGAGQVEDCSSWVSTAECPSKYANYFAMWVECFLNGTNTGNQLIGIYFNH